MTTREIAAGLTKAQREALCRFSPNWMTCAEAGATGMAAILLCTRRPSLLDRQWVTWGPDRHREQLRGEGYEYRWTKDGAAVRRELEQPQ